MVEGTLLSPAFPCLEEVALSQPRLDPPLAGLPWEHAPKTDNTLKTLFIVRPPLIAVPPV